MSELISLGISHKTAPVEVRERLALDERRAERLLRELTAHDEVHEAVAISTCNRTELYLVAGDPVQAEADALARLATHAGIRPTELAHVVYTPRNCDAARQLYRVASGLESMIVGEAEVQGQVRRAYELALAAGTTGPLTNRLFRAALEAGKRVRTQTAIGRERVSVSTVAVELARGQPPRGRGQAGARAGRRPGRAQRRRHRRRRDERAHGAGARRPGRHDDLHRQPPRRPRPRAGRSLRRRGRLARRAPRAAARRRHRRRLDGLAALADRHG